MAELRAVTRELPLKLWITVLLVSAVCTGYFLVGHFPIRPVTQLEATSIEDAIGFHPEWIWVYVSLYLFLPVGPLLLTERRPLVRYARGMLGIAAVGCLVFLLLPTATQRPELPPDAPALYRLIVTVDPVTNAAPSLHCAFTAYSLGIAAVATAGFGSARLWRIGLSLWWAAICFSTLATRQHMLIDVVTGVALGGATYFLLWRRRGARSPAPREHP